MNAVRPAEQRFSTVYRELDNASKARQLADCLLKVQGSSFYGGRMAIPSPKHREWLTGKFLIDRLIRDCGRRVLSDVGHLVGLAADVRPQYFGVSHVTENS